MVPESTIDSSKTNAMASDSGFGSLNSENSSPQVNESKEIDGARQKKSANAASYLFSSSEDEDALFGGDVLKVNAPKAAETQNISAKTQNISAKPFGLPTNKVSSDVAPITATNSVKAPTQPLQTPEPKDLFASGSEPKDLFASGSESESDFIFGSSISRAKNQVSEQRPQKNDAVSAADKAPLFDDDSGDDLFNDGEWGDDLFNDGEWGFQWLSRPLS